VPEVIPHDVSTRDTPGAGMTGQQQQ